MIKSKQVWAEEHTDVGGEKNFEYKHLCISLQAGMVHSDYLAFLINLELFIFIWPPPPPQKKKNMASCPSGWGFLHCSLAQHRACMALSHITAPCGHHTRCPSGILFMSLGQTETPASHLQILGGNSLLGKRAVWDFQLKMNKQNTSTTFQTSREARGTSQSNWGWRKTVNSVLHVLPLLEASTAAVPCSWWKYENLKLIFGTNENKTQLRSW